MRILIDTHVLLFFLEGHESLQKPHQQIISDNENDVFVSIASLWEIGIKISIEKLQLSQPLENVIKQISSGGFEFLPITPKHIVEVSKLSFFHSDPFDRIIIAQANVENLPIISQDKNFATYGLKML